MPPRECRRHGNYAPANFCCACVREPIEAERDFLLARMYGDSEWVGLSSDALTHHAITGEPPRRPPYDWGDYFRCVETYRRAPEHLKPAMRPWLDRWYDFVEDRHPGEESDEWHTRHRPVAA